MKEEQNLNKIAKYLSDNSDSMEREDLFAWVKESPENKKLLEDGMEVWEVAEPSDLAFQPDMEAAWGKMDSRLTEARAEKSVEAKVRPITLFRPWMRIAAAAIILLGLAFWLYPEFNGNSMIEKETIAQQKTTIDLPDGSKVWLNQNSTLKYEKRFNKRIVYLEGEAFFDVAKLAGKSFEIYAGKSKTSVLGTSFNIRAYPDENKVEIAVESGKVDFSAENKPSENELLIKEEFATYTKSSQEVRKLEMAKLNAAAWKKGALRFDNSKMDEVIESLERYYEIKIDVQNNKIFNCVWTNTQTYEQPVLDTLIKRINFISGKALKLEQKEGRFYQAAGKGCK